jgi:hypothetical protein
MGVCARCDGKKTCQDDFHDGSFSVASLIGDCPSCGDDNAQRRPPCPHCKGRGHDEDDFFPSSADLDLGFDIEEESSPKYPDRSTNPSSYTSVVSDSDYNISANSGTIIGNYRTDRDAYKLFHPKDRSKKSIINANFSPIFTNLIWFLAIQIFSLTMMFFGSRLNCSTFYSPHSFGSLISQLLLIIISGVIYILGMIISLPSFFIGYPFGLNPWFFATSTC